MKLFEFSYHGCQAFIDVDEVIQVYAGDGQSDAVYILYHNGTEKHFTLGMKVRINSAKTF